MQGWGWGTISSEPRGLGEGDIKAEFRRIMRHGLMGIEGVVSGKGLPNAFNPEQGREVRFYKLPPCKEARPLVGASGHPLGQSSTDALPQSLGFRGGRWGWQEEGRKSRTPSPASTFPGDIYRKFRSQGTSVD